MVNFVFKNTKKPDEQMLLKCAQKVLTGILDDIELYHKREREGTIRTVPYILDLVQMERPVLDITNEEGEPAGKFGWCNECRKPANYYCKDTKDPVCSEQCKRSHARTMDVGENKFFKDSIVIFRYICTLSDSYRAWVLNLELIKDLTNKPDIYVCQSKEFVEIIRTILCENLLKSSLSTDNSIFTLSVSIFENLVCFYKDTLKIEIGVFMNDVFLKLLES